MHTNQHASPYLFSVSSYLAEITCKIKLLRNTGLRRYAANAGGELFLIFFGVLLGLKWILLGFLAKNWRAKPRLVHP